MALSTVLAVGAAFIVNGLASYVPGASGPVGLVIAGVVAIVVGYATKNMK